MLSDFMFDGIIQALIVRSCKEATGVRNRNLVSGREPPSVVHVRLLPSRRKRRVVRVGIDWIKDQLAKEIQNVHQELQEDLDDDKEYFLQNHQVIWACTDHHRFKRWWSVQCFFFHYKKIQRYILSMTHSTTHKTKVTPCNASSNS